MCHIHMCVGDHGNCDDAHEFHIQEEGSKTSRVWYVKMCDGVTKNIIIKKREVKTRTHISAFFLVNLFHKNAPAIFLSHLLTPGTMRMCPPECDVNVPSSENWILRKSVPLSGYCVYREEFY